MRHFEVKQVQTQSIFCFDGLLNSFIDSLFGLGGACIGKVVTRRKFKFDMLNLQELVQADLANPQVATLANTPRHRDDNAVVNDWDGSKWHDEEPPLTIRIGPAGTRQPR